MDASFELPDSTDWIATSLPAFEALEAALRCEACKEFYENPVTTSCSHTFCSKCIRRSISADGKCPSCRASCSADKLVPNTALREVVMRFESARPKALELARAEKERANNIESVASKKRKLEEAGVEAGENMRQTRSRWTRSQGQSYAGTEGTPVELDNEEDVEDEEFLPEGMAKCPICNQPMPEAQVFGHLDKCPGQSPSQGRSTRSKAKVVFPVALQRRQKEPSPPPTRLSQLNYAMLKDGALRKKLQEIGIPSWGSKDLMKRRHIEWLNIHNSNCDAHESVRKSKRLLLQELTEWENTQGGRAQAKDDGIMRKDFDASGHAKSHKSNFDDLIARARQKRTTARAEPEPKIEPCVDTQEHGTCLMSAPLADTSVTRNNGSEPQSRQPNSSNVDTNQPNFLNNGLTSSETMNTGIADDGLHSHNLRLHEPADSQSHLKAESSNVTLSPNCGHHTTIEGVFGTDAQHTREYRGLLDSSRSLAEPSGLPCQPTVPSSAGGKPVTDGADVTSRARTHTEEIGSRNAPVLQP